MINPFRPSGNFAGGERREGGITYEIPKGANNIGDCVASFILLKGKCYCSNDAKEKITWITDSLYCRLHYMEDFVTIPTVLRLICIATVQFYCCRRCFLKIPDWSKIRLITILERKSKCDCFLFDFLFKNICHIISILAFFKLKKIHFL